MDEKTSGDRDSDKVVGRSPNEVLDHFSVRSAGTVPAITVAVAGELLRGPILRVIGL